MASAEACETRGRDVGERGGGEDLVGTLLVDLLARLGEVGDGAAGGVELHGERDQLEEHGRAEGDDRDPDEARHPQDDASEEEQGPRALGDVHHGHERRADRDGRVAHGMLDGVARLMAGDGDGRHRAAEAVVLREVQRVVARIVVVGERAVDLGEAHVGDARVQEHVLGDFCAGPVEGGVDGRPLGVYLLDVTLGERTQQRRDECDEHVAHIEAAVVVHRSPSIRLCNAQRGGVAAPLSLRATLLYYPSR